MEQGPKITLTFVDADGGPDETISLEELQKQNQAAEAHRKAVEGEGKTCRCERDFRDPECKQRYSTACPWEEFHYARPADRPSN
jgi:hypothetical protein